MKNTFLICLLLVFAGCSQKGPTVEEKLIDSIQGAWAQTGLSCDDDPSKFDATKNSEDQSSLEIEGHKAILQTRKNGCETRLKFEVAAERNTLIWKAGSVESKGCSQSPTKPLGDLRFSVERSSRYLKLGSLNRNLGCGLLQKL